MCTGIYDDILIIAQLFFLQDAFYSNSRENNSTAGFDKKGTLMYI